MFQELIRENDACVIVPAFNESSQIVASLEKLKKYFESIVVVDDGSSDNTFEVLKPLDIHLLRHPINLGQGAALQTGILYAINNLESSHLITFDADGQHDVKNAIDMLGEIKKSQVEIILGSRFLVSDHTELVPNKKKVILRLGIFYTRILTGLPVTDVHNGLRVMSRNFASRINIHQSGMAHASEILEFIKNEKYSWKEFPAEISYSSYSIKKGQSIFNAINIFTEMTHKWQ